jgi:hypothetical protein
LKAELIPAKHEHIAHIAANVRDADRRELYDYMLLSPKEALERSFASSGLVWTWLIDDVPVVMFGVVPASFLSNTGFPWMISTVEVENHQLTFLRRCKPVVKKMTLCYSRLENCVAVYNVKAIQWLAWLGFQFGETEPMGMFKVPFIKFYMETK